MLLDAGTVERVFRKVIQVRETIKQYCLAPDRPDLSVEDFQYVVEQMCELKIVKLQVPFEGEFLRGMMARNNGNVTIYVKKNMEEDWKRFISVKELCHLIIDEDEDRSAEGVKTIRQLLSEYKTMKEKLAPRTAQSETFAEIAAIELLFPFEERKSVLQGNMKDSSFSIARLANWYKVPDFIIAKALDEAYHSFACEAWDSLNTR